MRFECDGQVVLLVNDSQKETVLQYLGTPILLADGDWLGIVQVASFCIEDYSIAAILKDVIAHKDWAIQEFGDIAYKRAVKSLEENNFTIE